MEYEKIKPTNYKDPIGEIMSLWKFFDFVHEGYLIPSDGCIGDIIINGHDTNLYHPTWGYNFADKRKAITFQDLCNHYFETKERIEIRWCNK